MRLECLPGFDYAREQHGIVRTDTGVVFESESSHRLGLSVPEEWELQLYKGRVISEFDISAGESTCVVWV